jgi:hypothetical protein
MQTAGHWIKALDLSRHPEGGFYREAYRSREEIPARALPDRYAGQRTFATSIYFLLPSDEVSVFHRLKSDEVWHFYQGSFLSLYMISPAGELREIRLSGNFEAGHVFQAVVPSGNWFGAAVGEPDSYSLVGCTVAPGFEFIDFELGQREKLLSLFPQHQDVILKLTRS